MQRHHSFIDLKNKLNFETEIVGIKDPRTLTIKHNEKRFQVKINKPANIIKLLSEVQIEKLNAFMETDMKGVIFNAKEQRKGITPDVEITKEEENVLSFIDDSIKKFIQKEKKPVPVTYIARFDKHRKDNIVTVKTNDNKYKTVLDLMDSHYSKYSDSDRELIDLLVREKLNENDFLRISTASDVGFNQLANIEYKKNSKWIDLGGEIKRLINPYEETCEKGRQIFKGIITNVIDGDTVELFNGLEKIRIRLDGIDAPESNQGGGAKSTRRLTQLIYGKEVQIAYRQDDKYERIVGTIYTKNKYEQFEKNINQQLVKEGLAWAEGSAYYLQEKEARENDLGIWKDDPVYPSYFRKNQTYFLNKQKPNWKSAQEKKAAKQNKKSIFGKKN